MNVWVLAKGRLVRADKIMLVDEPSDTSLNVVADLAGEGKRLEVASALAANTDQLPNDFGISLVSKIAHYSGLRNAVVLAAGFESGKGWDWRVRQLP